MEEIQIPIQIPPPNQEDSHYSTINEEISIKEQRRDKLQVESILHENLITFDEALDQIKFGKHQILSYFVSIILGITEGAQVTIFTLMIPILQTQWNLSQEIVSLQISFVFVGFLIGSLVSGQFTDRFGRRKPFIISSALTVLVCFATLLSTNIEELLIMRALLGIFVGFFAPCCVTLLQEITPNNLRGQMTSTVTFSVAIGQLYGFFVASLIIDSDLSQGNWRLLIFLGTMPGLLGFIMTLIYIEESPRFELLQGRYESAFIVMRHMIEKNKSEFVLNEEMQHNLIMWSLHMNGIAKNLRKISYLSLLSKDRRKITLILWGIWISLCLAYYGNLMMMPNILKQLHSNQNSLLQLVYACFSDIFGAILASLVIDREGLGRRNSLVIGFLISGIISFVVCWEYVEYFSIFAIGQKLFLSMNFIFCYQLTCELYPTRLRATGLGVAVAMGRLGGILMPWACMLAKSWGVVGSFYVFGIVLILGGILSLGLPKDSLELDRQN